MLRLRAYRASSQFIVHYCCFSLLFLFLLFSPQYVLYSIAGQRRRSSRRSFCFLGIKNFVSLGHLTYGAKLTKLFRLFVYILTVCHWSFALTINTLSLLLGFCSGLLPKSPGPRSRILARGRYSQSCSVYARKIRNNRPGPIAIMNCGTWSANGK